MVLDAINPTQATQPLRMDGFLRKRDLGLSRKCISMIAAKKWGKW
jgi:hypothetical protein